MSENSRARRGRGPVRSDREPDELGSGDGIIQDSYINILARDLCYNICMYSKKEQNISRVGLIIKQHIFNFNLLQADTGIIKGELEAKDMVDKVKDKAATSMVVVE